MKLTLEEKQAVDGLEKILTNPPILGLPQATGHYTLNADTCDTQVGCVLLQQKLEGTDRQIDVWSITLSETAKNIATTHEDCLAVVWAVLLLWPYLEGSLFIFQLIMKPSNGN